MTLKQRDRQRSITASSNNSLTVFPSLSFLLSSVTHLPSSLRDKIDQRFPKWDNLVSIST